LKSLALRIKDKFRRIPKVVTSSCIESKDKIYTTDTEKLFPDNAVFLNERNKQIQYLNYESSYYDWTMEQRCTEKKSVRVRFYAESRIGDGYYISQLGHSKHYQMGVTYNLWKELPSRSGNRQLNFYVLKPWHILQFGEMLNIEYNPIKEYISPAGIDELCTLAKSVARDASTKKISFQVFDLNDIDDAKTAGRLIEKIQSR